MRLKNIITILNIFALIGCIIWLIVEGGWEPIVAIVVAISTLIGQVVGDRDAKSVKMQQRGGDQSTMLQSGKDINITS